MAGAGYWQRSFSRRKILRSLAYGGAGLTAAALVGCGSKPEPATTSTTSASQPKLGGEFRQPATADIYDLDVTYEGQTGPNGAAALAVESLLGFKYGPGVDPYTTDLVPRLAEKWETPDATNFTFQLRKGVNFAAVPPVAAREVTSADWKFSLEYESRPNANQQFAKLPQAFYNWLLFGIDRVDAPDPYTVVVRFKQPYAPFLNYAAGQRKEADPVKRKELERQACAYIADQCWHLAVFRDVSYTVSHPNVKGLQIIWGAASDDWAKNTWVER